MTDQYQQEDINLLDGEPSTFTTPNEIPFAVTIDQLTADGDAVMVQMFGGGLDPAAITANNYTCLFRVMFTRVAGVVTPTSIRANVVPTGTAVLIAPVAGNVSAVQFLVTVAAAPGVPYNHRWKVSKIRF